LRSYSRAELPLPSSPAAQPALRQERTSNQAPPFKKRIGTTQAPKAPPPQPAHLVSRQNPAPKVAKLPRSDPAERLRSPEISAIATRRHGYQGRVIALISYRKRGSRPVGSVAASRTRPSPRALGMTSWTVNLSYEAAVCERSISTAILYTQEAARAILL
jgi:hypothetical protein